MKWYPMKIYSSVSNHYDFYFTENRPTLARRRFHYINKRIVSYCNNFSKLDHFTRAKRRLCFSSSIMKIEERISHGKIINAFCRKVLSPFLRCYLIYLYLFIQCLTFAEMLIKWKAKWRGWSRIILQINSCIQEIILSSKYLNKYSRTFC